MGTDAARRRDRERVPAWPLAKRGFTAACVAIIVNAALSLGADAAGIAPDLAPLSVGPVVRWTVAGVAGATVVYWLLDRSAAATERTFRRVAAAVLVVSAVATVLYVSTLSGATQAGALVLALMHLTTAAVAVAVIGATFGPVVDRRV